MATVGYWIVTALLLHVCCRLLGCYCIITASVLDCICAYSMKYKWPQIIPELKYLNPEYYMCGALDEYGDWCAAETYEALKYTV